MVKIQFVIDGVVELSRMMVGVSTSIEDWTPALSASATQILDFITNDVFDSEGSALEQPWQELSPMYAAIKEHRYPGQPILVATGKMRDSFNALIDPTTLTIGNTAPYFVYHQSSLPRHRLPRRVMLGLSQNLKEMIVKNFQQQILTAAGA